MQYPGGCDGGADCGGGADGCGADGDGGGDDGHRFVTTHPQLPLNSGQTQHLHFLEVGKTNLNE